MENKKNWTAPQLVDLMAVDTESSPTSAVSGDGGGGSNIYSPIS